MLDKDHIQRMYREAQDYIHDADLLSRKTSKSDANAIIGVLGFEILLKCMLKIILPSEKRYDHNYYSIWMKIPEEIQNTIIEKANIRMSLHANYDNMENLLNNFQKVFMKARYYYEFYEGKTLEEQSLEGKAWVENGMPMEEATIAYHPNELYGLTYSLSEFIESKLNEPIDNI